ncbi:stage II sporulation protein P [Roseburia hominis]|nr:stage II sporulation protein P [Roseburia hominis]
MQLDYILQDENNDRTAAEFIIHTPEKLFLVCNYMASGSDYETQIESSLSYEEIVAKEAADEPEVKDGTMTNKKETGGCENQVTSMENSVNSTNTGEFVLSETPKEQISLEKLNDFDYFIHNFYVVDRTTTINSSQLNVGELLARNMKLTHGPETPQILIYHTHSQEGYADSIPGDKSTTVMGLGEILTKILTERYGFHVIHHTGEYDVENRDNAYAKAGPALEQILAENPSIEVVIDLHRDGVADTTRLVTEVNGTKMASIMFFNGLSRTTATGDIPYLYNPNLKDNLAFSLQMQLMAKQYYPNLVRPIYLKGYRYNMHYCPKSLLVEVGAQTNTVEEARNAMEPLADVLYRVLSGNE